MRHHQSRGRRQLGPSLCPERGGKVTASGQLGWLQVAFEPPRRQRRPRPFRAFKAPAPRLRCAPGILHMECRPAAVPRAEQSAMHLSMHLAGSGRAYLPSSASRCSVTSPVTPSAMEKTHRPAPHRDVRKPVTRPTAGDPSTATSRPCSIAASPIPHPPHINPEVLASSTCREEKDSRPGGPQSARSRPTLNPCSLSTYQPLLPPRVRDAWLGGTSVASPRQLHRLVSSTAGRCLRCAGTGPDF